MAHRSPRQPHTRAGSATRVRGEQRGQHLGGRDEGGGAARRGVVVEPVGRGQRRVEYGGAGADQQAERCQQQELATRTECRRDREHRETARGGPLPAYPVDQRRERGAHREGGQAPSPRSWPSAATPPPETSMGTRKVL